MMAALDVTTRQEPEIQPEEFQAEIIKQMVRHLKNRRSPALLRAPTGSGKTFMIGQVLELMTNEHPTVWFWFVPYTNLVGQTINALAGSKILKLLQLSKEIQRDHGSGDVLIANVQQVSSKTQQRQVFNPISEMTPTILEVTAMARSAKLHIGVVIDEAHIGVSAETEFGKFVKKLKPDTLIMATATPKDQKLSDFLNASGYSECEAFSVSRQQVVDARLNKEFIAAYVYRISDRWKEFADLQRAILRQAWRTHLALKAALSACHIDLTPLMLVQVENGRDSTKPAVQFLLEECGVPIGAIGEHTSDDPDPVMMSRIAGDMSKEVLIFKESAGVGFDAPRAFILASTKPVTDTDYALQFIGRVMRVERRMREALRQAKITGRALPDDLNTAFIYLANPDAQEGFQKAVSLIQTIKSGLEGQTEKLKQIKTRSGVTVFTNRPTNQPSVIPDMSAVPETEEVSSSESALSQSSEQQRVNAGGTVSVSVPPGDPSQINVDGNAIQIALFDGLDIAELPAPILPKLSSNRIKNSEELQYGFTELNIKTYSLRTDLDHFYPRLKTEERPSVVDLSKLARNLALGIEFSSEDLTEAMNVATGSLQATEHITELTTGITEEDHFIGVPLHKKTLIARAWQALRENIKLEDADIRLFLSILEQRLKEHKTLGRLLLVSATPTEQQREIIRDIGLALTIMLRPQIAERYQQAIAGQVKSILAEKVPDVMVFPEAIPLLPSKRNIYGVTPPTVRGDLPMVEQTLLYEERRFLKDAIYTLEDGKQISVGYYDGATGVYEGEKIFSQKLDQAPFVVWWHRNPDRKPFSVALARPDSSHNFYPDFVICVRYYEDDEPSIRLVDTKHDVKDVVKKSRRSHVDYKRVVFLTGDKESGQFFIVNENGTLGARVDSSLDALKDTLRKSESL